MRKIFSFICIMMVCMAISSCSVYNTDDYYTDRNHYPIYSIYYRPVYTPTRHHHHNYRPMPPRPKPKPHYNHTPHPKPTPNPRPHGHNNSNHKPNHKPDRR